MKKWILAISIALVASVAYAYHQIFNIWGLPYFHKNYGVGGVVFPFIMLFLLVTLLIRIVLFVLDKAVFGKMSSEKAAKRKRKAYIVAMVCVLVSAGIVLFTLVLPNTHSGVPVAVDTNIAAIPNINKVELFGVENGVAYYTVYVQESFDWEHASFEERSVLIKNAIHDCNERMSDDGATGVSVNGFIDRQTEPGRSNTAFSWDGGDSVRIYSRDIISGLTGSEVFHIDELP